MRAFCLAVGMLCWAVQLQAAPMLADDFDGSSVSASWTVGSSGNVGVSGSYLNVNSGGSVKSVVGGSVATDGTLTATFTNVKVDDWSVNNMSLGLYSADGTKSIVINQPGYGDICQLVITNASGTAYNYLEFGSWGIVGPELRNPGGQTWTITVTASAVTVNVGSYTMTLNQGDGTYGSAVDIPTGELFVGFVGNSGGNFSVDQISYVPEPMTLALLTIGGVAMLRRRVQG